MEKGGASAFGGLPSLDYSTCIRDMRKSIDLYTAMKMPRKGAHYVLAVCLKGSSQGGWEDQ